MKTQIRVFAIILFCLGWTVSCKAQIATKSIGTDSVTGLQQNVNVWSLSINARTSEVFVTYNIETLAPNGIAVYQGPDMIYRRFNKPASGGNAADMRYDALSASSVGRMIAGMIANDLSKWPNLQQ